MAAVVPAGGCYGSDELGWSSSCFTMVSISWESPSMHLGECWKTGQCTGLACMLEIHASKMDAKCLSSDPSGSVGYYTQTSLAPTKSRTIHQLLLWSHTDCCKSLSMNRVIWNFLWHPLLKASTIKSIISSLVISYHWLPTYFIGAI